MADYKFGLPSFLGGNGFIQPISNYGNYSTTANPDYWYDADGNYYDSFDYRQGGSNPLLNFANQTGITENLVDGNGNKLDIVANGNNGNGLNLGGLLGGIGLVGQIGTSILGAMQGQQALNMAKKQFNFQKDLANRNLANQAKVINNAYDNAGRVTAGLMGSNGLVRQDDVDRMARQARNQYVNGSAIG